jgi:hypothetical protein
MDCFDNDIPAEASAHGNSTAASSSHYSGFAWQRRSEPACIIETTFVGK